MEKIRSLPERRALGSRPALDRSLEGSEAVSETLRDGQSVEPRTELPAKPRGEIDVEGRGLDSGHAATPASADPGAPADGATGEVLALAPTPLTFRAKWVTPDRGQCGRTSTSVGTHYWGLGVQIGSERPPGESDSSIDANFACNVSGAPGDPIVPFCGFGRTVSYPHPVTSACPRLNAPNECSAPAICAGDGQTGRSSWERAASVTGSTTIRVDLRGGTLQDRSNEIWFNLEVDPATGSVTPGGPGDRDFKVETLTAECVTWRSLEVLWEFCWEISMPEVCDARDNDLDGEIDEGLGTAANPIVGGTCTDVNGCPSTGATWCQNGMPASACTTRTDLPAESEHECIDTKGCPRKAIDTCAGGAVVPICPPETEVDDSCNGVDDDCDGRFDEDYDNFRHSCDPADPNRDCAGAAAGTCCGTQTRFCRVGQEWESACIAPPFGVERPDGKDNDCDHYIDECDEDPTAWWCQCSGGDAAFTVATNFDPLDPLLPADQREAAIEAAADECLPDSEGPDPSGPFCSLRGLFRWAERLDYLGCRVVGALPVGVFRIEDELRLGAGNLRLEGMGSDPDGSDATGMLCDPIEDPTCMPSGTTITTMVPCAGPRDCGCLNASNHRLINAIAAERAHMSDEAGRNAGISLGLELGDLVLRGGQIPDSGVDPTTGGFLAEPQAGGSVVVEKGSFAASYVVIQDNRTRGRGVGLGAFDCDFVSITDSVIRDNFNTQGIASFTEAPPFCRPTAGQGGGVTGSGGIFLASVVQAEITRSAIIRNIGPDGGGIYATEGGRLVVTNSTISENRAAAGGGGIWTSVPTELFFNTIYSNAAGDYPQVSRECIDVGGGLYLRGSSVTGAGSTLAAFGNIIASNSSPRVASTAECASPRPATTPDCASFLDVAHVAGAAFNLIRGSTAGCDGLVDPNNEGTLVGAMFDPRLVPLPDTPVSSEALVHALQDGSAALGAYVPGPGSIAPTCEEATGGMDQRRYIRPAGGAPCALGSYDDGVFLEFRPSRAVPGVFAGAELTVRDRARVQSTFGAASFSVGFDAVVGGSAFSRGSGYLADRATIRGDAKLAGVLGGNRSGVEGALEENTPVTLNALPVRPGSSSGPAVTVPNDGFVTLTPGNYGALLVRSRGTLELTGSGLYRFTSVLFEPDGSLSISGADPEAAIASDGAIVLGDRFQMSVNGQSTLESWHLFLYSSGASVEYGHDSAVIGDLEAPFGHVEVRDRSFVRGAVRGSAVTIGFDAIVGPNAASPEEPEPPPPPGAPFTAVLTVTGDWGSGYCASVDVTNHAASATVTWNAVLNMSSTTSYTTWNGGFSSSTGTITVTPGAPWNASVAPGATNNTVGFCATRDAPGSGTLASVVSASATY